MQQEIDFNGISLHKENNKHSQEILEAQEKRLSNNCRTLYDALKRGERLTGKDIIYRYNMIEYRRRFKDLISAGVPVKSAMEGNSKVWWL